MELFVKLTCIIVWIGVSIQAQESFDFYNKKVEPGKRAHIQVLITKGKDSIHIPVTIFHGIASGPVLGITAGVHGYEYPPIIAGQKLIHKIDPKTLRGTIILVQVANVASFMKRSPYVNPIDNKNLNRSFPGKKDGSITEQIAYFITSNIIDRSNFFVDMHSGDAPEDLLAYNAWYNSSALPEVSKKGKEMALAMGFDYTVVFNINKERLNQPSLYCSQEAFHRGIPSVDIECGRLGRSDPDDVDRITKAIMALLTHLKMVADREITNINNTIITERFSIKSDINGIFYSSKKAGDLIKAGESIGYITDYFGTKQQNVIAPKNGMILYMIGTPPINKGETIMNIALLP